MSTEISRRTMLTRMMAASAGMPAEYLKTGDETLLGAL